MIQRGVVALILRRNTPAGMAQSILDKYGLCLQHEIQAPLGSFVVVVPEGSEKEWVEKLRSDPEVLESGFYSAA